MIQRQLAKVLQRFAEFYPIVGITGPHQSGKTTLAKMLFTQLPYVSLENPDSRLYEQTDPRNFLQHYSNGVILDEIQHVPLLLSYLQQIVDESMIKGRFVLTGSQNFTLSASIAQSLSGRIGMSTLLPCSLTELDIDNDYETILFRGGYPSLYQRAMSPADFYPSYIQTYLERDIRQLKNIENLGKFQAFLKICAGRVGQLINFTALAQDVGISPTTARAWLTLLEASYIIFLLPPYHQNFNKRVIKMPKLYFYDTGLACHLLGLEKASQLNTHYLKGALVENLVILELLKGRLNQGLIPNLYFWRDQSGHEVDCLLETGGKLKAIEIKSSHTFHPSLLKGLKHFNKLVPESECYLVYNGLQEGTYQNITLLTLKELSVLIYIT